VNFKKDAFSVMSEVTQEKQFLKGNLQDEIIRKDFFQGGKKGKFLSEYCMITILALT